MTTFRDLMNDRDQWRDRARDQEQQHHEQARDLALKNRNLRVALEELLELHEIKQRLGKTAEYEQRQPKAWEAAREVLGFKTNRMRDAMCQTAMPDACEQRPER